MNEYEKRAAKYAAMLEKECGPNVRVVYDGKDDIETVPVTGKYTLDIMGHKKKVDSPSWLEIAKLANPYIVKTNSRFPFLEDIEQTKEREYMLIFGS